MASLSHDLRTPLRSLREVQVACERIAQRISLDQQDQLLETIYQRSLSMSTEVSDLLEMTRLNAGAVTLARQWYPMEELIGAALERCRSVIGKRVVSVVLPDEMCLVHVDGVLIEKLFVNLIENAALHTPADTPIHILGVRQLDSLVICVRDEGGGLPADSEALIFEMFERVRRAGASTGSGLGLSICRVIADLHGLAISARNRPEGGAEFSVQFPTERATQMHVNT